MTCAWPSVPLARRPSITIVAVLSLAIGIGLNTAIFSLVDALLLRPPAVKDPHPDEIRSQTSAFSATTGYKCTTMRLVTVAAPKYFDTLGHLPASNHNFDADAEPPFFNLVLAGAARLAARYHRARHGIERHRYRVAAVLAPEFRGIEAIGSRQT